MEKLSELSAQLQIEKKKPKNERNNKLMSDLQDQIWKHKAILRSGYQKRRMEKRMEEVALNLSLWKKKNEMYAKIREAKKKELLEAEKRKDQKSQAKKSK